MKKTLAFILCAAMLLALLAGCGAQPAGVSVNEEAKLAAQEIFSTTAEPEETKTSPEPEETKTFPEPPAPDELKTTDGIHGDILFSEMEWSSYDTATFYEQLEVLKTAKDFAVVQKAYDWLMQEYKRVFTLDELAWRHFYAKDQDRDWNAACEETDNLFSEMKDALKAGVAQALNGAAGAELRGYIGDCASALDGFSEVSAREQELTKQENAMIIEYNELMEREELTEQELNAEAGELYLRLIAVRNELAALKGYESYAEFAYQDRYSRDYTPEEAAKFAEELRPYAQDYYTYCYYCSVFSDGTLEELGTTPEEELDFLRRIAPEISDDAAEALAYMESHELALIDYIDSGITDCGYVTALPLYNSGILYNALYGDGLDLINTSHEFGHYFDAYINRPDNCMLQPGSMDVFEIHSTGMSVLASHWYDELFGENADAERIVLLDSLMGSIVSGCVYDEFQQYVYAHPDMTVEELNECYREIGESYGMEFWDDEDSYAWMYVSHNYESPFYYISYAVSAMATMQLYAMAEEDFDAALACYLDLIGRGAYDAGYCEVLKEVGLAVFSEDIGACLDEAYDIFDELCYRYDMAAEGVAV